MRLIPAMKKCCLCYSLKTGSFTIAFMLLVGSSIQTGYYGFLINNAKPLKLCTEYEYFHNRVLVYKILPTDTEVFSPFFPLYHYPFGLDFRRRRSMPEAKNVQEDPEGDMGSTNSAEKQAVNSTAIVTADAGTSSMERGTPTATKPPKYPYRGYRWPQRETRTRTGGTWVERTIQKSYITRCRKPRRMPFDIDVDSLNFDLEGPFNKDILYVNLCLFGTMMCLTPLLMYAVYKESRTLLLCWMVAETLLLSAAVATTIAASVRLLEVLQVSVGIVTLFNMAFHLVIDIYYVMVVFNFREKLEINEESETEEIQI